MLDLTAHDREIHTARVAAVSHSQFGASGCWLLHWLKAEVISNGWRAVNLAILNVECLVEPQLLHLLLTRPRLEYIAGFHASRWVTSFTR